MFLYIARFVDTPQFTRAPQGGSYFAFSLVGFVFLDYLNAALDTFDRSLEEARDSGTLEHLLVTQTSLPVFLAGSAIYPFAATTLRIVVYVAWAAALFVFPCMPRIGSQSSPYCSQRFSHFRASEFYRRVTFFYSSVESRQVVFSWSLQCCRRHALPGEHPGRTGCRSSRISIP